METDVTIYCLTYNHATFIRAALDGFLMQKTTYIYKIFVYDDASTDGTTDILREYKEKYPEIFELYINEKNIYHDSDKSSFFQKMYREHIKSKYVAWCEGDDCWINIDKLQLQLDYLETHSECSMVAHATQWVDCRTDEIKEYHPYQESRYLLPEEVILQPNGNLSTASFVFRRDVLVRDETFPKCDVEDIPMQLSALSKGKIFYINKVMSMYRYMRDGSWSSSFYDNIEMAWEHKLCMANFYRQYDFYSHYRFHEWIQTIQRRCLYLPIERSGEIESDKVSELARLINDRTNDRFQDWIKAQMDIICMKCMPHYINLSVKEAVREKRYTVIMGTGYNAQKMTLKLQYANIHLDGYVISDNQRLSVEKLIRPVWKLSQYPYAWDNTALIIAIGEQFQEEIENNLRENGIIEFVAPYWINI